MSVLEVESLESNVWPRGRAPT